MNLEDILAAIAEFPVEDLFALARAVVDLLAKKTTAELAAMRAGAAASEAAVDAELRSGK